MLTKVYVNTVAFLESLKREERGVTAIEYAIVAVAIAALVTVVYGADGEGSLRVAIEGLFEKITTILDDFNPPTT